MGKAGDIKEIGNLYKTSVLRISIVKCLLYLIREYFNDS